VVARLQRRGRVPVEHKAIVDSKAVDRHRLGQVHVAGRIHVLEHEAVEVRLKGQHAPVKLDYQSISRTTCLIDISLKGALVKAPEDWQLSIGCRLDLSVALNGADSAIHMQAQVAHIEPGQIGLLCDGIDMQSITHLRRLVELNLGDNALLERDLQALG